MKVDTLSDRSMGTSILEVPPQRRIMRNIEYTMFDV